MLCDICHENQALFHIKEVTDQHTRTLNLCRQCAAEKGLDSDNLESGLPSLLSNLAAELLPEPKKPDANNTADTPDLPPACPDCGLTTLEFKETGRLGCPSCYTYFREILTPGLDAIHRDVIHRGRKPYDPTDEKRQQLNPSEIDGMLRDLNEQLQRAVATESYERAANLRDRINQLTAQQTDGS